LLLLACSLFITLISPRLKFFLPFLLFLPGLWVAPPLLFPEN